VNSITMNRGQVSRLCGSAVSVSELSTICLFFWGGVCLPCLAEVIHHPRSPPTMEPYKRICKAAVSDRCTPEIRGRYTQIMRHD
jgi:hypothetical protein